MLIFNAIRNEGKNDNMFFHGNGQWTKGQFFLFEAKSLGLFKSISPLIKYCMFKEKCQFESSRIVGVKDAAAALVSATVCGREELHRRIVDP